MNKTLILDGIDRDILRVLYSRRPLNGNQISKYVGLTPAAVYIRLRSLEKLGILKISKSHKLRRFKRNFGKGDVSIKSSRGLYWNLDFVK